MVQTKVRCLMIARKVKLVFWVLVGLGLLAFWGIVLFNYLSPSPQPRTTSQVSVRFLIKPDADWKRQVDHVAVSIRSVCEESGLVPTVTIDDTEVAAGKVDLHATFGLVEKEKLDALTEKLKALSFYEGDGVFLKQMGYMLFYEPGEARAFSTIKLSGEELERIKRGEVHQSPLP